jgi:hypothetical protein
MTRRSKDKAARAAHIAELLHQKIAHERSQPATAEREAHLRALMGLPAAPAQPETDQEHSK